MDLVRPFSQEKGENEYLVVAVDYFTQWSEVKVLDSITSKQVKDFFWQDIICRYGVPKFDAQSFGDFCQKLNIEQRFASVAHPQTNGLAEVTNRTIMKRVEKYLKEFKRNWVEEFTSILRAYRTTPRKGTSESLFCLCFEIEALVPMKIGTLSQRNMEFNAAENAKLMREDLLLQDRVRNAVVQWGALQKGSYMVP